MSTGYLIIARTKWLSDTVRGTHAREREREDPGEISDRGQQGNSIATARLTKEVLLPSLSLFLAIHKSEPLFLYIISIQFDAKIKN